MTQQAILDPITNPQSWDYCTIGGVQNPGIVAPGGITGFKRDQTWDVKKGKGAKGATTTLSQLPPAKGSIKFLLWNVSHFEAWNTTFRALFKYDPTKTTKQAVDIYHPALANIDVTSVVTESLGPETYEGKGLWSVTVDLLEYLPPPPVTITATPTGSTAAGGGSNPSGTSDDPIADEQQKQIAALLKQAQAP